jgi:catechol 2,3-dioxygenase-like lactoylglutathione lyase family enzyme
MLKISYVNVWVHDQDEALEWYTKKLGMELREDVTLPELGDFRWLSVGPADQPDVALVLMAIPGPPVFDDETRAKLAELLAKGAAGGIFLTTDDCRSQYETLSSRGVEFTETPSERPYGVDAGLRDVSGNSIRLVQPPAAAG